MECEHRLITPAFRLMAPFFMINDDACHNGAERGQNIPRLFTMPEWESWNKEALIKFLVISYNGVRYETRYI